MFLPHSWQQHLTLPEQMDIGGAWGMMGGLEQGRGSQPCWAAPMPGAAKAAGGWVVQLTTVPKM